jgi:hypothetical protein
MVRTCESGLGKKRMRQCRGANKTNMMILCGSVGVAIDNDQHIMMI